MSERTYRFKRPRGSEEYLEAIYEEISRSPGGSRDNRLDTLKDYLVAVLTHAKSVEFAREVEKKDGDRRVSWALGGLFFLSLAFLLNGTAGYGDIAWLYENRFPIKLWGIGFAIVFVGVSIEKSSFFRSLWAFGFTKFVASLAVSALVVFSTGKASLLINSVFSVDGSALPYTRAIVATILALQYSYPLIVIVAVFAVGHALHTIEWVNVKLNKDTYTSAPVQSLAFLFLSVVVLLFSYRWVYNDFSQSAWPSKVYLLAHKLDFNSKHECSNLRDGLKVVFLGAGQARVLVDENDVQTDDIESFIDGSRSREVTVPLKFPVLPCEVMVGSGADLVSGAQRRGPP